MRFGVDEFEGLSLGAHGEGFADAGFESWIGNPFVGDVRGFVAAFADVDKLTHEASGRCARDASIFLHEVTQAAFCIGGGLAAFLFVGHVYKEFNEASVVPFRNLIVEGVDDDAQSADVYFVQLRVIYVTGEAGVVPEDQSVGALIGAEVEVDHVLELIAVCSGAA